MCRSIHTLYHVDPPVTQEEIHQAALQFVRKVSGYHKPSKANEAVFLAAVDEIAESTSQLLAKLETNAPPRLIKAHSEHHSYGGTRDDRASLLTAE